MDDSTLYTIFHGNRKMHTGNLLDTLTHLKTHPGPLDVQHNILIFNDQTGSTIDFDLRGSLEEVLDRHQTTPKAGRGRPKLGVVAREVTLFPRHWEWLEQQPGGASAALRRLIEEARKKDENAVRQAQIAADRFMQVMAGDLSGYQEASRALYTSDRARFEMHIGHWPEDIKTHTLKLAEPAFQ